MNATDPTLETNHSESTIHEDGIALTAAFKAVTFLGIPLSITGLVLDLFTLTALGRVRLSFPSMRVVLMSLCVADALLALSTLGLLSADYHGGAQRWADEYAQRRAGCAVEVLRWLWDIATSAHLFMLLALAGQQFISIRWPLHSDNWLSARCSAVSLAGVWAASCVPAAVQASIIAAATDSDEHVDSWPQKGTTRFCYQVVRYVHYDTYTRKYTLPYGQGNYERALTLAEAIVKGCVLVAIAVSYGYVFATVHRLSEHSLAHSGDPQSLHCRRSDRRRGERRVAITAFVVTLLFLVCYLPLICHNMLRIYSDFTYSWPIETGAALQMAVCATSVLDPIVYVFRLKELRSGLRRVALRWRGHKRRSRDDRLAGVAGPVRAFAAAVFFRLCCHDRDICCPPPWGSSSWKTSALTLSPHISIDATKTTSIAPLVNGKAERPASPVTLHRTAIEQDAADSLIQSDPC